MNKGNEGPDLNEILASVYQKLAVETSKKHLAVLILEELEDSDLTKKQINALIEAGIVRLREKPDLN